MKNKGLSIPRKGSFPYDSNRNPYVLLKNKFFVKNKKAIKTPKKTHTHKLSLPSAPEFNRMCSYKKLMYWYISFTSKSSVFFHSIKREKKKKTLTKFLLINFLFNKTSITVLDSAKTFL